MIYSTKHTREKSITLARNENQTSVMHFTLTNVNNMSNIARIKAKKSEIFAYVCFDVNLDHLVFHLMANDGLISFHCVRA
jgi:hypothetical protein